MAIYSLTNYIQDQATRFEKESQTSHWRTCNRFKYEHYLLVQHPKYIGLTPHVDSCQNWTKSYGSQHSQCFCNCTILGENLDNCRTRIGPIQGSMIRINRALYGLATNSDHSKKSLVIYINKWYLKQAELTKTFV